MTFFSTQMEKPRRKMMKNRLMGKMKRRLGTAL